MCKNDNICNPATCSCKNGKYIGSIIDDSVITCGEIIEEAKTISMKKVTCEKFLYFIYLFIYYGSIIDNC